MSKTITSLPLHIDRVYKEKEAMLPVYVPLHPQTHREKSHSWRARGLVISIVLFVLGSIFYNSRKTVINEPVPVARNPSYLIKAKSGAVASENQVCSQMGVDTLKDGGNAVDAAIATTLCIGVVNMFSSGIGGGGFMTVRVPVGSGSEVWTIDFRETAPGLASSTMYINDPSASRVGGLASGVPGELRGLEEAHRRWGTLDWKRLVTPSVELAKGWPVGKELSNRLQIKFFQSLLLDNPDWSAIFAPQGKMLKEGEIIRRTNLSRTLATIAEEGVDAFYQGPIADSIIEKVKSSGGILTHTDLLGYSVITQPALKGSYLGKKVYTTHAPTSGSVLLHMLNLMEHYDLPDEGHTGLNTHRLVEAMKYGFAARTRICDPDYTDDLERINMIPTKEYADLIAANITDEKTHQPGYYNPTFSVETDHGTSHSSVVDKNGMAVAITSTVNLLFGSQVMDPITGVILNDEMDDFSNPGKSNGFGLYPSPYNYPEPGKRPLSSTAPTVIENADGSFYAALGGSGGSRIFPSVFQVMLNLDWGLNIRDAIEHGRVHDQLYPQYVDADNIYPPELLGALKQRGHNVTVFDINRIAAVIQGVVSDGEYLWAASDSRKNGIAAGY